MLDTERRRRSLLEKGIYATVLQDKLIGALTRQQTLSAIDCRVCSAKRGVACTGFDQTKQHPHSRKLLKDDKSHPERQRDALKHYGLVSPQSVLRGQHIDAWYKDFRKFLKDPDSVAVVTRRQRRKSSRPSARASKGMTIRYECPLCGQEHPRAECRSLRALAERRRKQRAA